MRKKGEEWMETDEGGEEKGDEVGENGKEEYVRSDRKERRERRGVGGNRRGRGRERG